MAEESPIFTPDNEPYLGRKPLYILDVTISAALSETAKIAPHTTEVRQGTMQSACLELVPSGVSIALSIRELLRQGHVFGAYVLCRPLLERAFTTLYLFSFPNGLKIWSDGWEYNKRPKLPQIMRDLDSNGLLEGQNAMKGLNALIHADPKSSPLLLFIDSDGNQKSALGRNLARPDICDEVCDLTISSLSILLGVASGAFNLKGNKPC